MEDNEEHEHSEQEQLTAQFRMFEQQIRMIQEQQQAVEQAIVELGTLNLELDDLIGKKDNDIMAPIGRGIYASAKLTSEELLVDIGNKNFVKKSIPETKKILQEQLKKLEKVKEELNGELEKINVELTKVFMDSQRIPGHSHEGCTCTEECKCEDGECDCEGKCKCENDEDEED
jgi:prefoldin alpha subunit